MTVAIYHMQLLVLDYIEFEYTDRSQIEEKTYVKGVEKYNKFRCFHTGREGLLTGLIKLCNSYSMYDVCYGLCNQPIKRMGDLGLSC